MTDAIRIGARGITRRFGSLTANDDVTLGIAPGSIHAIVGENGAGKTTLMRMLQGLDRPDAGTVVLDDEPVRLGGPADAARRGIGMVHQELNLVPELTLLENLVLGHEPMRRGAIDWRAAHEAGARLVDETGLEVDWGQPAAAASLVARQRLEILRLLHRDADVLILDEPTAALAPPQVAELLKLLRRLRDGGRTVVFISHKLGEVLDVADRVTVLRRGRVTGGAPTGELDETQLVRLMSEDVPAVRVRRRAPRGGEPLLRVDRLEADDDLRLRRLRGVSLEVHAGEVLGVAGVAGNGQDELVDCLVGLRRPAAGRIELLGEDVTRSPIADRRRIGLAFIPADRRADGLAIDASVTDNVVAGAQRSEALVRDAWFRRGSRQRRARSVVEAFDVRCAGLDAPAGSMSGGNQQRLILGRELAGEPRVVIASQPTRGVDVKGAAAIREQLVALRDRDAAVVLVSEELDELGPERPHRGAGRRHGRGCRRRARGRPHRARPADDPARGGLTMAATGQATGAAGLPRLDVRGCSRDPPARDPDRRRTARGRRRARRHGPGPGLGLPADAARGVRLRRADRGDALRRDAAAVHGSRHGHRVPCRDLQRRGRGQLLSRRAGRRGLGAALDVPGLLRSPFASRSAPRSARSGRCRPPS